MRFAGSCAVGQRGFGQGEMLQGAILQPAPVPQSHCLWQRGPPGEDPLGFSWDLFLFLQEPHLPAGCCYAKRGHLQGLFLMEEQRLPIDPPAPKPSRMAAMTELVHP